MRLLAFALVALAGCATASGESRVADADVFVAIWEDGTRTKVLRGENAGETLGSERVVRRLEHVAAAGKVGRIVVPLDGRWKVGGAVVFAQRTDRKIIGAKLLGR